MTAHFILYVRDQGASARFYERVLDLAPALNVPGMTEFRLSPDGVLGLMPERGIKRLLGDSIPDPEATNGAARAELYLVVPEPERFAERAEAAGGRLLSPMATRNWGHKAVYFADPDGHVLAFATPLIAGFGV